MTTNDFPNLPDVVLSAIFTSFCGDEPVLLPRRTTDRRGILSRVGKRWQAILESTSTLWNHILFTSPASPPLLPSDLLDEFYTCTTRSRNNLLTITFNMAHQNWGFSIVYSVILPNVGRIQKLICPIHTNNDISAFLTIPEGNFRALESIDVAFVDMWAPLSAWFPSDPCGNFNVFRMAPNLRSCTAHLLNGLLPCHLYLPWNQLAFLDLAAIAMSPETFVEIIHSGALQLEECFFQLRFKRLPSPQQILSENTITMEKLKILKLRLIQPSNDTRFFSIFQFPALRSLTIDMFDRRQHWDVSIYIDLLRASNNTLQFLHLSDLRPSRLRIFRSYPVIRQYHQTTHRDLEDMFDVIPNIESLILPYGLPIHVVTAEKLATCNLLPRLRILEIGASIASAQHILSVLKRRHDYISLGVGNSGTVHHPPAAARTTVIRGLDLWIPHHRYISKAALALDLQSRLLAALGIVVHIRPTNDLPLPIS